MRYLWGTCVLFCALFGASCSGHSSDHDDVSDQMQGKDLAGTEGVSDLSWDAPGVEVVGDVVELADGWGDVAQDLEDSSELDDATQTETLDESVEESLEELFVADWECPSGTLTFPECDPEAGDLAVSGYAYVFGPPWGTIGGATVRILELPGVTATTESDGYFKFDALPRCSDLTFEMEEDGYPVTRTETFKLSGPDDITEVAFQVPTMEMRDLLAKVLGVAISPEACQIASTVSLKEMSLTHYLVPHGVPGATVTICPIPGVAAQPIYFAYISDEMILPDYTLQETSADGGVLFVNVPPGDYVLRAFKEGTSFPEVRVRCEAGLFVNASPPKGLHELGE